MASGWERTSVASVLGGATLLLALVARADGVTPAAQALFDDAKRLMAEGRYSEACPMLEESDRLVPGVGTEYNLADCHERLGRTATAWAEFIAVASAAHLRGQSDREEVARGRAKTLESHLARLVIVVPAESRAPALEVKRDGDPVGASQWDREIPVDPGQHAIAARDGARAWRTSIDVAPGATVRVTIGALEAPPAPEAHHDPVPRSTSTRTITAITLGAVGVAGLAIGTVFGLQSISKYDDSQPYCHGNACTPDGLGLRDDSIRAGNVATVAILIGAAALITGGVVWLTTPSTKPPAPAANR